MVDWVVVDLVDLVMIVRIQWHQSQSQDLVYLPMKSQKDWIS